MAKQGLKIKIFSNILYNNYTITNVHYRDASNLKKRLQNLTILKTLFNIFGSDEPHFFA